MQAPEQPGPRWEGSLRATATLDQITGAPMPVREFLTLAVRVADELAALHARGAIHLDIRPSTIRFDAATGELALGPPLAGSRPAAPSEGSLPYISPEQTGQM